ncbi:hypothetical protein PoMZ_12667 [Pyricularia oryzae]|uniref:Uncharacterized protein n=1 Tax=Pyricularia oryzae TaxID=318829 RepID=A0A4P7NT69_PYROR|nr:hypothetical protein PoMZ_12667 [Pyricularia oryzae]
MKLLTRMIELRSEGARAGYIYQKAPIRKVEPLRQTKSEKGSLAHASQHQMNLCSGPS